MRFDGDYNDALMVMVRFIVGEINCRPGLKSVPARLQTRPKP
jgi:hypothetical protein